MSTLSEDLLDAVRNAPTPEEFKRRLDAALTQGFQQVSDAAWRHGLEALADELEVGLGDAHRHGLPPATCCLNVADLVMAIRVKASRPPQLPRRPATTGGPPEGVRVEYACAWLTEIAHHLVVNGARLEPEAQEAALLSALRSVARIAHERALRGVEQGARS
jgi:hypothetical protein